MRPPRPSTAPAPDAPLIVTASKFKAKVADYLRLVERTGGTIIVTNRGRQTAMITSIGRRPGNTFVGAARGALRVQPGTTPLSTLPSWNSTTPTPAATPEPNAAPLLAEPSRKQSSAKQRLLTTGES